MQSEVIIVRRRKSCKIWRVGEPVARTATQVAGNAGGALVIRWETDAGTYLPECPFRLLSRLVTLSRGGWPSAVPAKGKRRRLARGALVRGAQPSNAGSERAEDKMSLALFLTVCAAIALVAQVIGSYGWYGWLGVAALCLFAAVSWRQALRGTQT